MVVRIAAHGSRCGNMYVYVCVRSHGYHEQSNFYPVALDCFLAFLERLLHCAEIRLVFKRRLSPARAQGVAGGWRRYRVNQTGDERRRGSVRRGAAQVGRRSWRNVRQEKEVKRQCLESRIDLIEDSPGILLQASLSAARDRRTCPDCGPIRNEQPPRVRHLAPPGPPSEAQSPSFLSGMMETRLN